MEAAYRYATTLAAVAWVLLGLGMGRRSEERGQGTYLWTSPDGQCLKLNWKSA